MCKSKFCFYFQIKQNVCVDGSLCGSPSICAPMKLVQMVISSEPSPRPACCLTRSAGETQRFRKTPTERGGRHTVQRGSIIFHLSASQLLSECSVLSCFSARQVSIPPQGAKSGLPTSGLHGFIKQCVPCQANVLVLMTLTVAMQRTWATLATTSSDYFRYSKNCSNKKKRHLNILHDKISVDCFWGFCR